MPEKPSSLDKKEKELQCYNDRLHNALRKQDFPEKDLGIPWCYSADEFREKFGEKYKLESLEGFDYVLSADRSGYIIEYVRFNTEEEFKRGCERLADAFRVREDEPRNQLKEKLSSVTDKTINGFSAKVKDALNRVWNHVSKYDFGELITPQPIEFSDKIFEKFEPDELVLLTSLLVKKVLTDGKLSKTEIFQSDDGKRIICEMSEDGWTFQVKESEAEPEKGVDYYESLKCQKLLEYGCPESELWLTECTSTEAFRRLYGDDLYFDLELDKYVVYYHESGGVEQHDGFNNEEEFEKACKWVAEYLKPAEKENRT